MYSKSILLYFFSSPKLMLRGQNLLGWRKCHHSCRYMKIFTPLGFIRSQLLHLEYRHIGYTCWCFFMPDNWTRQADIYYTKLSMSRIKQHLFNRLPTLHFDFWLFHNLKTMWFLCGVLLLLLYLHLRDEFHSNSSHARILC